MKSFILQFLIVGFLNNILGVNSVRNFFTNEPIRPNPDAGKDIYEFVKEQNYPIETHYVHTDDGYILRMQRIPSGRNVNNNISEIKPVVLLMHGFLCSAMDFVNMGPNKSLGIILADEGYDVWLGNNRGTTWSRQHVNLDPDVDEKYWEFSFQEFGEYDLPAKIDYILKETGQEKILYVGHSQGTTQFFAMKPEYFNKIEFMAALAPVAYVNHTRGILRTLEDNRDGIEPQLRERKMFEILNHTEKLSSSLTWLSTDGSPYQESIANYLLAICGNDSSQLNTTVLPVIFSNMPAGTSLKNFVHFSQEVKSGYFRRYDYEDKNYDIYNSTNPPIFNLRAITLPVALYSAKNDYIAAPEDVAVLAKELPNIVEEKIIENGKFNHIDFLIANDVKELLYDHLLKLMKQYTPNGGKSTTSTTAPAPGPDCGKGNVNNIAFGATAVVIFVTILNSYD